VGGKYLEIVDANLEKHENTTGKPDVAKELKKGEYCVW
jgi:hypothetical protein